MSIDLCRKRVCRQASRAGAWALAAVALAGVGCAPGPNFVAVADRPTIDRTQVEYPNNMVLTPFIGGLTAPVAVGFEADDPRYKDCVVVAEGSSGGLFDGGLQNGEPTIIGFRPTGEPFPIYPRFTRIPLIDDAFRLYGPIGGMALAHGKIYVAHRDASGFGVITALDYDGHHTTIVADLPALGDYGITDVAVHPSNGRLYFGVGAATNSGVVGLDNFESGWIDAHPDAADRPYTNVKLNGYRFTTRNPNGGLFGGDDIAVTAPFQAFGTSRQLRIPASPVGKPTAAIYSVNIDGGDLRVEAHGIRLPRGLVFNDFGNLFATNDGMELRGTRPVKDDPDSVLRVPLGGQVWYGFPDFSTDLRPIGSLPKPPEAMLIRTGYPELAAVIDHEASGLSPPDRNGLLQGVFPPLSGAAKMAFVPDQPSEPFKPYRGKLIVALAGDRAPFANSGQPLTRPQGYSVQIVDREFKLVADFVVNTKRLPASQIKHAEYELERPIDAKFGPDGALYIVDYGRMEMRHGQERVDRRSGRIYRLGAPAVPTTEPAADGPAKRVRNYQE